MKNKNKQMRTLEPKKLAKRLGAYSAAAAATVATQGSANAAEVIWDIADVTVNSATDGVFFNMTNGSTFAAVGSPSTHPGYKYYNYAQGIMRLDPGGSAPGGYLYGPAYTGAVPSGGLGFVGTGVGMYQAVNISRPPGSADSISAGDNFVLGSPGFFKNFYAFLGNNWTNGDKGVAGIRFKLGANTHYGWAEISRVDADNFTLHRFGYDDTPDAPSGIPEPSSVMLFAVGAAGLGMRRKRKVA